MRTVWKFDIDLMHLDSASSTLIEMPSGAELLHVGVQNPVNITTLTLWALVESCAPDEFVPRRVYVYGTGHRVADDLAHVGTAITANGGLVWHVFDGGEA